MSKITHNDIILYPEEVVRYCCDEEEDNLKEFIKQIRHDTKQEVYQILIDKLYTDFNNIKGREIATILIRKLKKYKIELLGSDNK